jgi:hypothetical protein
MTLSDADLEEHLKPIVEAGYILNPLEFKNIAAWNHILVQIHMASHYLEMLRKTDDGTGVDETEALYLENAYFVAFLTTYAKCFVSAGDRLVKLDAKDVFRDDSSSRQVHERIMELRHSYAAHNGASGLVRGTVAVDAYVVRRMNQQLDKLGTVESR